MAIKHHGTVENAPKTSPRAGQRNRFGKNQLHRIQIWHAKSKKGTSDQMCLGREEQGLWSRAKTENRQGSCAILMLHSARWEDLGEPYNPKNGRKRVEGRHADDGKAGGRSRWSWRKVARGPEQGDAWRQPNPDSWGEV